MSNVKVSVIMSTSNTKQEFLKLAIESILNQSFEDFEFIIVNDGGNDKDIINKYKDRRIILIENKERMGLPYSLNEAIKISKGKYIARMDSDDIALKSRFKNQVKYMEKHPDVAMTAMFKKKIGNENEFIFDVWNNPKEVESQLFFSNVISHPSVMFRKSFLEENNLNYSVEYSYAQDFELWTRIIKFGKIKIIPKLGVYYRIHNSQVSSSKKNLQYNLHENIIIRNLEELNLDKLNLKYIKMLSGRIKEIDPYILSDFIDNVVDNNKIKNIYDEKVFKKILYNMFFIRLARAGLINFETLKNKNIRKKILKSYNIIYILKRFYYKILINFNYFMDNIKKI